MEILRKENLLVLSAAVLGIFSTAFLEIRPNLLGLWAIMPLLWLEAESKRSAFLAAFAFYLAISCGVVPGAYVFFRDGSFLRASALWISSAAALALPWGLLWSEKRKYWRIVLAVLISIPPPLGLIGWGNPLTAAGLFFPGLGWLGLALMLAIYSATAMFSTLRRALIIFALLTAHFLSLPALPSKTTVGDVTILGLNTSFGRVASGSGDFDTQFERERMVFRYINEKKRDGDLDGVDIVVLPETIVGRMNPTTAKRWERFFEPFAQDGMVFIVGGEIPTDRGMKYDNVMVAFEGGGKRQVAKQRFPVPGSMYRPFGDSGANAYLSSLGDISIMVILGKKLGFLVCYEQFLTWPVLSLMSQRPDAIAAPANLWWCSDTSLPDVRTAAVGLWARLFGVQVIVAVNLYASPPCWLASEDPRNSQVLFA